MKKNMGTLDRGLRLAVALVLGGLTYFNIIPGTLGIILSVLALIFVITSFISFCPLYLPFGINTCKKE